MILKDSNHILVRCQCCDQEKIVKTVRKHYCSPECSSNKLKAYWKKAWLKRKVDPVAREHTKKAKAKYYQNSKKK